LEKNLKGSLPPAAVDEDATRRKGHLSVEGHPSGATAESIPRLSTQQLIQFGPADVHWDELTGRR